MLEDAYITINQEPKTETEKLLVAIIVDIHEKLREYHKRNNLRLTNKEALELVCMITTNVFTNLVMQVLDDCQFSSDRMLAFNVCFDAVGKNSIELWRSLEASRANKDISH